MYALISVYDDENVCICKDRILDPSMVDHKGEVASYKFEFVSTVVENYKPVIKSKFKPYDIPEPEPFKHCMICGKILYDDRPICDKCFEIAKREGLLK